jgi:Sigma-70, region 4
MATFDQLAADQRAIIEIVLKQGRSYDQIADMLDLPPARVRELARDALTELAPFTADLVDPQWRGQLADYVLGQQVGPEAQATRGHLRRSEPARIWTYSLLDALDDFYADGERPEIPLGESGPSVRSRAAERAPRANGEAPASPLSVRGRPRVGAGSTLSAAARTALLRRRIAAGLGATVVIALLVFGGLKLFGGSDHKKAAAATTTSPAASQGQGQVVAQAALTPVGNFRGQGVAVVYQSGNQALLLLRAKLPPTTGSNKYLIWLYNSEKQLTPVAGDVTDRQGNLQGAQTLPQGWQNFRFVDLTLQSTKAKQLRHGAPVMRGPLLAVQPNSGTGAGTGTSTTP